MRLRVGLRPEASFACARESVILYVEVIAAVERRLDLVAWNGDFDRVLRTGRDLKAFLGAELHSLARDNFVNPEVVFQRIHSCNVVVVCVLITPDETATLVIAAPDHLESHAYVYILETGIVGHAEVELGVRTLGQLS
jgi:hypothetical protein